MYQPITGTGDGSAPVVNLTFAYIDEDHVKASVDDVEVTFTWTGASQVTFDAVVASGAAWAVYRDTPIDAPMVDFQDASVLTAGDLDLQDQQLRFHQEEVDARVDAGNAAHTSAVAAAASEAAAEASASSAAADAVSTAADVVAAAASEAAAAASAAAASGSQTAAAASAAAASASEDAAEAARAVAEAAVSIPSAAIPAANRAAMATLATSAPGHLMEAGREGMFVFDSSDLSALVTADPEEGIYVAPASDATGASGAWVRKFDGLINVRWFGATGDGVTDDSAAFLAALAYLKNIAGNGDIYYAASPSLFVPAGHYYLGTTTLDITHTLTIEGESNGLSGAPATQLRWAAGATGIRVQRFNTTGADDVLAPGQNAGDGSIFRGLRLQGGYAGTEGEFHGFHLRARATIEDCHIEDFQGDGIHIRASAGAGAPDEGNANSFALNRVNSHGNRHGIYIEGADANAGTVYQANASGNRQWGIWDSSFLGNTYVGCHAAANGWDGALGSFPTGTSYLGNRYAVKVGQAVGAKSNAPSGTTADNTWWLYVGAGGAYNGVPLWAPDTYDFREGGAYKTDNVNAANVFLGCYSESDQGVSQLVRPTLVVGGLHGAALKGFYGQVVTRFNGTNVTDAVLSGSNTLVETDTATFGKVGAVGTGTATNIQTYYSNGFNGHNFRRADTNAFTGSLNSNTFGMAVHNTTEVRFHIGTEFGSSVIGKFTSAGLDLSAGKVLSVNSQQVIGAQGAAVADAAALTSVDATVAAADPTKAEFDAFVGEFNKLRDDLEATRTQLNTALARLRAHGLIAT